MKTKYFYAVLLLICVPLLLRYPVTKESHEKVLEELKARREREK
jgi:Na+/melibiose symporter-like transporter